jgi:hypothetical protein
MRVTQAVAVLAVLSLSALAIASPLNELSSTSISVAQNGPTPAHPTEDSISVTVQRVDELVGDAGDLVAARIVDVVFRFDMQDQNITLNGVPVKLGISSVEIDSVIVAGGDVASVPTDVLNMALGRGLAKVEVGAEAQELMLARADLVQDPATHPELANSTLPDIIDVRRYTVNARVVEIDGQKVVQTDLVEQIMDVYLGKVLRGKPKRIPSEQGMMGMRKTAAEMRKMKAAQAGDAYHGECLHHRRLANMWRRLPHTTRIAVAAFLGSLVLIVFFVAIPIAVYVHWKERRMGAYHRLSDGNTLVQVDGPLLEGKYNDADDGFDDDNEDDDDASVRMEDVNHHTATKDYVKV